MKMIGVETEISEENTSKSFWHIQLDQFALLDMYHSIRAVSLLISIMIS